DVRWSVGVSINVPLDLGGKRRGEVDAARADRRRVARELDEQALKIESELQIARSRIEEALERTTLLDMELVPLAEHNLEAALDAYAAGEGRFLEVLDAQRQQLTLQEELARAQADHFQALALLERWSGKRLPALTP
ncbi:MAG: TolC family protein, partial [Gammaproteobacteria bacterium]